MPEHNPHVLNGTVVVPNNVTLTLRPGVVVQANSSTGQYNGWGYAAINVAYSTLNLESSVVSNSANNSVADYGVHLCCTSGSAKAVISDTLFTNLGNSLSDYAVYSLGSTNPFTVTNSVFQNNAGYPIHTPAEILHQITGNTFSGNGRDRILVLYGSVANGTRLTAQAGLEGYELSGLSVRAGQTLFVDPGVMLMARSNTDIRVNGHLEAIGTPTQPITFTSAANSGPEQWGSLYVQEGSADLRYSTFRYGGQLISGNIVAGALLLQSTADPSRRFNLDHVTVRENAYSGGAAEYAVSLNGGAVTMNATSVISNGNTASDYGIYLNAGVVTATHTLVQNNAGRGLHISNGRFRMTCGTISGNGEDGIRVGGGSGSTFIGTGIYQNTGIGLNNTTPQMITATYNWWGSPSGPGGVGPGSGDEVSANVEYAPWLSSEDCFTGLFIDKTAEDVNGAPLYAGDLILYTMQVTNTGNIDQTNLVVTDTLPVEVTFVNADPLNYSGPNPLKWTVSKLAPGEVWTATITAMVNSSVSSISGNVAQAASDPQPLIQTGAILPPGGGVVFRRLFLPVIVRQEALPTKAVRIRPTHASPAPSRCAARRR